MGSPFKYTLFQELEVKIFQLVATFSFVKRLAHSACPSTSAQNVVFAFKNSLQKTSKAALWELFLSRELLDGLIKMLRFWLWFCWVVPKPLSHNIILVSTALQTMHGKHNENNEGAVSGSCSNWVKKTLIWGTLFTRDGIVTYAF